MSFIQEDDIKGEGRGTLAPMIDFLFLMLVFFASLAVSRVTTKDTEINLVKAKEENAPSVAQSDEEYKIINITITESGKYKWVTDIRDYEMLSTIAITNELIQQYERGLLPIDKFKTQVLLKIDKRAQWEPILKAIFAIRDIGFEVRPIYEPEDEEIKAIVEMQSANPNLAL